MNGLPLFSLLIALVCGVAYGYRMLTDTAFTTSKYNEGLTRAFLVSSVGFTVVAIFVAIIEKVG